MQFIRFMQQDCICRASHLTKTCMGSQVEAGSPALTWSRELLCLGLSFL